MKTAALIFTLLLSTAVLAQSQKPTTGYAPVNGLKMYYEIHGSGEPLVLLHGSFMTISNNWTGWIGELSKTHKVIAVEMQGHGRTTDINRPFSHENLADDIAAMLDHLKIRQADLLGYSMGGGVAMQVAIRHPDKVRKVVSISAVFRHDGWVEEALDAFPQLTADTLKGSPIETEYKKLSPTPNEFPNFVKRVIAMDLRPYDFGADRLKATKAPFLFIHGDEPMRDVQHVSTYIARRPSEVYEFASDPKNLPRWAAGLARSQVRKEGDVWLMDSPLGKVRVKFAERNAFGVMDHDVTLESGVTVHNPMRADLNTLKNLLEGEPSPVEGQRRR